MNSSSALGTGLIGVSGAAIGALVVYLFTIAHLPPPPEGVAETIGGILMFAAHASANIVKRRLAATPEKV